MEYAGPIYSDVRRNLESFFANSQKQDLNAEAIQKIFAYRVIDVGSWIQHGQGPVSLIASDFKAKQAVCDLFPVCSDTRYYGPSSNPTF